MTTPAERYRFLDHQGRRFILLDFSGITHTHEGLRRRLEVFATRDEALAWLMTQ